MVSTYVFTPLCFEQNQNQNTSEEEELLQIRDIMKTKDVRNTNAEDCKAGWVFKSCFKCIKICNFKQNKNLYMA